MTTTVVRDGVTYTTTASPWTVEDRALLLAWRTYSDSLCTGCGHPKATAWHHLSDPGDFRFDGEFVCLPCTAARKPDEDGKREPVTYPVVLATRDYAADPLPGPPEPQVL